jgi:hypothetical protein
MFNQLNDEDSARLAIKLLVKIHGYSFVANEASDARSDIAYEERMEANHGLNGVLGRPNRNSKLYPLSSLLETD